LVDWRTQFKTLRKLKAEGLIKYIGITHYTTTAFSSLAEVIESEKGIDFLQIPYSIVELTGEERLIPKAASKGVAVIANEPFGNGQLFRLTKNKNLPSWCQEIGITSWSQFFLKFILSNPDVQFVIPGSSNKDHVRDNMLAGTGVLPSLKQREEMKKIF
jgi:diketogulonate reductase-like aldo/keto reductase